VMRDIVEWDIVNWSRAVAFWSEHANLHDEKLKCLELGGRRGGLSLYLALQGHDVVCSDLENPENLAQQLHKAHGVESNITYEAIDALNIPYREAFDLIVFKSVLGGASRENQHQNKNIAISEIYRALKPGGILLFAENLSASGLHRFFRKRFVKWGSDWNYLNRSHIDYLLSEFENVQTNTFGFFGAFGRSEFQREIGGKIDVFLEPIIPQQFRYLISAVARKPWSKQENRQAPTGGKQRN
ncbi:MAG TPA: class I SAM-dependent methyltransferase, partial [Cryomorphaceae bacterium]|nr:class I SAM-dependent methyltransferase [Cryomorphaceae bacterium]